MKISLQTVSVGMSLRIAPGVRIRASGSGIRTSVGPRAARVHVGGGRAAVSSGFGPFTASSPMRGRRSAAANPTRPAASTRTPPPSRADTQPDEIEHQCRWWDRHRNGHGPTRHEARPAPQFARVRPGGAYRFRIECSSRRRHAVSGNLLQRSVHFIRRWYQLDVLRVRRSCPSRLHTELCSTQ
jgi:hypothetical protein